MDGNKKVWERAWTLEEMQQNAGSWSLAGDAGLLKYLEEFSDNMFKRAEEVNTRLDALLDNLDDTQVSLDLINNKFNGLHNTQFIENRVYEEDETSPSNLRNIQMEHSSSSEQVPDDNVSLNNSSMEEERINDMREAIMIGLEVVDTYYDKVQVPVESDSEEDEEAPKEILRPKDIYGDRPLPYVIGTEMWHKKWHVGLLESDSEDEKLHQDKEEYSEDEEDDEKNNFRNPKQVIQNIIGESSESYSDTENDMLRAQNINQPMANSTFNDTLLPKKDNLFDSESDEEIKAVPKVSHGPSNAFAEQLAAKLGNVINQSEVNKKPIIRPDYHRNLLSDSPPPLDEENDVEDEKPGLFSSSKRGLFDDDHDNNKDNAFDEGDYVKPKSKFSSKLEESIKPTNVTSGGLFDDAEEDDFDDLFKPVTKIPQTGPSYLKPFRGHDDIPPLFNEQPPDLEPTVKKPIGGIAVIPSLPANTLPNKPAESLKKPSPTVTNLPKKVEVPPELKTEKLSVQMQKEKSILFEDDDDLFSEKPSTSKFTSGLFDSEPPPLDEISITKKDEQITSKSVVIANEEDLFKEIKKKKPEISLFDDPEEDDFDDLFAPKTSINKKVSTKQEKNVDKPAKLNTSLFDDGAASDDDGGLFKTSYSKPDLFSSSKNESKAEDPPKSLFASEKEKSSIFEDDLFTSVKTEENLFSSSKNETVKKEKEKKPSLFDDDMFSGTQTEYNIFSSSKNERIEKTKSNAVISIKTDKQDENEDIFNITKSKEPKNKLSEEEQANTNLFAAAAIVKEEKVDPLQENPSVLDTKSTNTFDDDNDAEDNVTEDEPQLNVGQMSTATISGIEQTASSLMDSTYMISQTEVESGIVKDHATFENVSSNFGTPTGASTRRFSSDMFSEQQKNDSLFLTKSHVDVRSPIPEIADDNSSSVSAVFDITPSGNANDLFSNEESATSSAGGAGDATLGNEQEALKNTSKNLSLFSDSDEDLFKKSSAKQKKKDSIFGSDDEDDPFATKGSALFEKSSTGGAGIVDKTGADSALQGVKGDNADKPALSTHKPPLDNSKLVEEKSTNSESANENTKTVSEMEKQPEDNATEPKPKVVSPGKLKMPNLNINVQALLPGAGFPRKREPSVASPEAENRPLPPLPSPKPDQQETQNRTDDSWKSRSEIVDAQRPISVSQMRGSLNINVGALLPSSPKQDNEDVHSPTEAPVSFEDNVVETLTTVTKTRARIAVKRRPSSRKGRQEMIRKSGLDWDKAVVAEEKPEENPLSPSTEEEDLFNISSKDVQDSEEDLFGGGQKSGGVKSKLEDLFSDQIKRQVNLETTASPFRAAAKEENAAPKDNLFDSGSTGRRKEEKGASLFDDFADDDDDDIFSSKKSSAAKLGAKPKLQQSKSLFGDDDDDDDDLFGTGGSTASFSKEFKPTTAKKLPVTSTSLVRSKLDESEVIEDPLDALKM